DECRPLEYETAGEVARAMMEWAIEKGASHYTHWFQPMTGATAEKRDSFLGFAGLNRTPILEFSAKALIKGEADGSSFPSGGLRATFEARGYTTWDCTSPAFIKRDGNGVSCLCIPTAFCAFSGESLDEKTPLLRSMEALNRQALRVLRALGDEKARRVVPTVGAEQEYFLIDKKSFIRRKDLAYTGRTLFGAAPAKGQELADQYYAATPERVVSFMNELNETLWRMGVPCKTEHNEVAPSQYELALLFESANVAVDHNQVVMEMMRRVAEHHELCCLLHEKPFDNVNGSGKHNNWSLMTDDGRNLLKPGKSERSNRIFLTFVMALVAAVDEYAEMLRLSCASIGNELRLGGHEAPTPVISVFLGEPLQNELARAAAGDGAAPHEKTLMSIGVSTLADVKKDDADRNRTSPFAFTGNKFEFRMVGASQSLGFPNTVLNTIAAEMLMRVADRLEQAADAAAAWQPLMAELYGAHGRVIFNGNNYDAAWTLEAALRGLPNIDNTVDAIRVSELPHVQEVFARHGVLTEGELAARRGVALYNYAMGGRIEAVTMLKIARQTIMPAVAAYAGSLTDTVYKSQGSGMSAPAQTAMLRDVNRRLNECRLAVAALESAVNRMPDMSANAADAAAAYRDNVLPRMRKLRAVVDALECIVGKGYWPQPSYGEMLFKIVPC
ncbi:MAG: glutamine synthetase III, partial [Clostridia bacterium]|nr:glutamine synthetase III [Clostridia bacterium]